MVDAKMNALTKKVINCAYKVSNKLGAGFLEKLYENALVIELHKADLQVKQQHSINVRCEDAVIGEYVADLLIEDCLLVELKTVESLDKIHLAQCLNYLKATGIKVCLLMNLAKTKLEVRRLVNHF